MTEKHQQGTMVLGCYCSNNISALFTHRRDISICAAAYECHKK